MILVIGGTGTVGREIVHVLGAKNMSFKLLVRDLERAHALFGDQVMLVQGDLNNQQSVAAALDQVNRLFFLVPPNPQHLQQELQVIDLATKARVKHMVKLSGGIKTLAPEIRAFATASNNHYQIEQRLREIGNQELAYTILNPNPFMQPLMYRFADMVKQWDEIRSPYGNAKINMIDVRDIAEAAVTCLTDDKHRNKSYTLTGSEILSVADVAAMISTITGRVISFQSQPQTQPAESFMQQHITAMTKALQMGIGDIMTSDFAEITGRLPRSLESFLRENRQLFAPHP